MELSQASRKLSHDLMPARETQVSLQIAELLLSRASHLPANQNIANHFLKEKAALLIAPQCFRNNGIRTLLNLGRENFQNQNSRTDLCIHSRSPLTDLALIFDLMLTELSIGPAKLKNTSLPTSASELCFDEEAHNQSETQLVSSKHNRDTHI